MSSFYDDASLVVIPSGYKTSKVYAEKPTDGSGDLTFTRTGDTATRVNSAGLIEKVRTNLILQSQTLDNASWAKTTVGGSITVTANYGAAPDGTNTADRVQISAPTAGAYADVLQTMSVTSGVELTYSVYLKSLSGTPTIIFYNDGVTGNKTATLTSSWARYTFTVSSSGTQAYPRFLVEDGVTSASADFLAWGAQLEYGVATAYIPTTTAAVSVGPVSNVPRLDYLGSTCPRLLLEPQRTNLYTYSEQLNQWTASSATVTANYAVSPDGYTNAERVQFAAGGLLYNGGTGSAGENTLSVYAKATNGTSAKFRFFGNGNTTNSIDQTATGQWQRFTFTYTYSALTAGLKVATTGADDILFYGFQHEIGAQATSYIPTLAASATRGADACSKTGISSLIGQTEGVLFADFVVNGRAQNANILNSEKNTNESFFLSLLTNGKIDAGLYASASPVARITEGSVSVGQRAKVAYAYKSGNSALYINGTLVGTSNATYTLPSSLDDLFLNDPTTYFSYQENVSFNQALLFKTRLTNSELAELTSL